MAEIGAHLSATSRDKASIFDYVAQESLIESLRPALSHALKVLAESNPSKLSRCYRFADEIHLALNALLQHHYMTHYGVSFSENFYDLKRVPLKVKNASKYLSFEKSSTVYKKSIAALVLFPYLKVKIENYYHKLIIENGNLSSAERQSEIRLKINQIFLQLWPAVHFIWELITLTFFVRYLVGRHSSQSPLLWLCGLSLGNLTESDYEYIEQRSNAISYLNVKNPSDAIKWLIENGSSGMKYMLETGAFFLQFLEWFYSSGSVDSTVGLFGDGEVIPPPQGRFDRVCKDETLCPLCMRVRKDDTVLSVSGYVFCYLCILQHLQINQYCPITFYPATTEQMIKIYIK